MSTTGRWIVALIAAVLTAAALGYWIGQRDSSDEMPVGDQAESSPATEGKRKVLYWRDPMVPGAKFDKPGKSPFMDMQLVPVYADEVQGGAVRVDSGVAQNLGIRLAKWSAGRVMLSSRPSAVSCSTSD
jgi:Cu(I)/Ag(I) efflux system membrane fusion protein